VEGCPPVAPHGRSVCCLGGSLTCSVSAQFVNVAVPARLTPVLLLSSSCSMLAPNPNWCDPFFGNNAGAIAADARWYCRCVGQDRSERSS
jgi:hypothetical protein